MQHIWHYWDVPCELLPSAIYFRKLFSEATFPSQIVAYACIVNRLKVTKALHLTVLKKSPQKYNIFAIIQFCQILPLPIEELDGHLVLTRYKQRLRKEQSFFKRTLCIILSCGLNFEVVSYCIMYKSKFNQNSPPTYLVTADRAAISGCACALDASVERNTSSAILTNVPVAQRRFRFTQATCKLCIT